MLASDAVILVYYCPRHSQSLVESYCFSAVAHWEARMATVESAYRSHAAGGILSDQYPTIVSSWLLPVAAIVILHLSRQFSNLVEYLLELVQLAELHQVEPCHICDPLARLGLHSIQVQGSATWQCKHHQHLILVSLTDMPSPLPWTQYCC